jgi:hypothetical protein
MLNPVNWPALASPAYGRSDLAAEYYDGILFNGATFGDILAKPDRRPFLNLVDGGVSGNLGVRSIVGQLMRAAGVPIDRYSYEQIELLHDMIERWAMLRERARLALLEGRPGDASDADLPQIEFYPIDVSFERIADAEWRRRFLSLPTSFVLPAHDVDALQQVAGELLRENAVYLRLVHDLGGNVPQ